MPIRPELRPFYGPEWRAYRAALIATHGALCTKCGRKTPRWLNLAHLLHDVRSSVVALLCAACHNRHDAPQRYAIWRRNRARASGQQWLLPEIEFAPYPTWMAPAIRVAEKGLFD